MQFITNGPDIPDALLQAHEDGSVVFFCGAGISYPAGLPGFEGLVKEIYQLTGTTFSDIEHEAFRREQFDATLELLERRLRGQRLGVCRMLRQGPTAVVEPRGCRTYRPQPWRSEPDPQAVASEALNSLRMLWVVAISAHSPFTFSSPRNQKRSSRLAPLI